MSAWYWRGVRAEAAILDDSEVETGEPPRRDLTIFAEPMSTYARSGDGRPYVAAPRRAGPLRKNYRVARSDGLSAEELAHAREVWARLPRWDDLVRTTTRVDA